MSFSNCFPGVGWDFYGTTTSTTFEQLPIRLTHLVVECSGMGSEFVLGAPIVWCHLLGDAIAQDIHIAGEVGPCPIQDNT